MSKFSDNPDIIPNSPNKQKALAFHAEACKFENSLVGYAVLFAGLTVERAKSIGIR